MFTSGTITGVIGRVFFPGDSNAVLKSLALVAVGFIVRPFGGAFFGPLGDKIGRKKVLAITILTMSMCTVLVGVLPTYAAIGLAAPIILLFLRLVQGFSTGGEYGGAATFIAEYAPTKRRGFFGAFLEVGTLTGYVIGNALVLIVSLSLGSSQMDSWGWRIPFLLALPMGLIGLYLRERLEDPPAFRALVQKNGEPEKVPLLETLHGYWPMILNLVGIVILLNVADYMLLTTMPSYFTEHLHVSDNTASLIIIGVELGQMALLVPLGALSDRIGRKPLLKRDRLPGAQLPGDPPDAGRPSVVAGPRLRRGRLPAWPSSAPPSRRCSPPTCATARSPSDTTSRRRCSAAPPVWSRSS